MIESVFFFQQKTACEMRISDWSSDVCSSDHTTLRGWGPVVTSNLLGQGAEPRKVVGTVNSVEFFLTLAVSATFIWHLGLADIAGEIGRASCRERGWQYG